MKELYLGLLEQGTSMNDIDEMDIYYYIELLSYKANKEIRQESNALDEAGL